MKRELAYVQMGLSGVSLLVWFLLPVFSFVFVIPLFNISGWFLTLRINQLMLFTLIGGILMIVAALINNRRLMITAGVLEIVIAVLTFVFRKDILLGGNYKLLYSSATLLVKKLPELVGMDTSAWDIQQVVTYICDNLLQPGIGLILHALCTLIYTVIAICAPNAKPIVTTGIGTGAGTGNTSGSTFNPKTTHQNTGYTHRT